MSSTDSESATLSDVLPLCGLLYCLSVSVCASVLAGVGGIHCPKMAHSSASYLTAPPESPVSST